MLPPPAEARAQVAPLSIVRPAGVKLADGREIAARTVVWLAGIRAMQVAVTDPRERESPPPAQHRGAWLEIQPPSPPLRAASALGAKRRPGYEPTRRSALADSRANSTGGASGPFVTWRSNVRS
jgi:hypothetical protein